LPSSSCTHVHILLGAFAGKNHARRISRSSPCSSGPGPLGPRHQRMPRLRREKSCSPNLSFLALQFGPGAAGPPAPEDAAPSQGKIMLAESLVPRPAVRARGRWAPGHQRMPRHRIRRPDFPLRALPSSSCTHVHILLGAFAGKNHARRIRLAGRQAMPLNCSGGVDGGSHR
jgi:hypothetical protein